MIIIAWFFGTVVAFTTAMWIVTIEETDKVKGYLILLATSMLWPFVVPIVIGFSIRDFLLWFKEKMNESEKSKDDS